VQNLVFGSCGQSSEIRETPHPFIIIWDDDGDLGLLEHELGNEDGVGIGGAAPGKIPAVVAVPVQEGAPE
jgi:hypothetical protein